MTTRRVSNFNYLLSRNLTDKEAGEFSILPKNDPTLRLIIRDRAKRRRDFERLAEHYIATGKWRRGDVPFKWLDNLAVMYRMRHWTVKYGPTGMQQRMDKGDGNPWAMFRWFERITPERRWVSPWQLRVYRGRTNLERGLIFIRKLERGKSKATLVQMLSWIQQKTDAFNKSRDPRRKKQLRREIRRLEAMTG